MSGRRRRRLGQRRQADDRRRCVSRTGSVIAALLLLGVSGTALTAGLTGVPAVSADRDVPPFPTFTASDLTYSEAAGVTAMSFTVEPAAGQVRARVLTGSEPPRDYQECTSTGSTTWSCPVPDLTAVEAEGGTFEFVAVP